MHVECAPGDAPFLPLAPVCPAALKKFLKKNVVGEELAILDKKLGGIVQEKLGIPCVYR